MGDAGIKYTEIQQAVVGYVYGKVINPQCACIWCVCMCACVHTDTEKLYPL